MSCMELENMVVTLTEYFVLENGKMFTQMTTNSNLYHGWLWEQEKQSELTKT